MTNPSRTIAFTGMTVSLLCLSTTPTAAQTLTKVADTLVSIPNVGLAQEFGAPAVTRSGRVAFDATINNWSFESVLHFDGVDLVEVFRTGGQFPNTSNFFNGIHGYMIDLTDSEISFGGWATRNGGGGSTTDNGAFRKTLGQSGQTLMAAKWQTQLPGTSGVFFETDTTHIALAGGAAYFEAAGDGGKVSGLYRHTPAGGLTRVLDNRMGITMPGSTDIFDRIGGIDASGDTVAFSARGRGSIGGVYTSTNGAIHRIADNQAPLPGRATVPDYFGNAVAIDGDNVAFTVVEYNDTFAFLPRLFLSEDGAIRDLAGAGTPVPHHPNQVMQSAGVQLYGFDGEISTSDGRVLFLGMWGAEDYGGFFYGGELGLYLHDGQQITRIIDTTQSLDGRDLTGLDIGTASLQGDAIAFTAHFADNSQAVYVVAIPEPASASVVALATALALRRSRLPVGGVCGAQS